MWFTDLETKSAQRESQHPSWDLNDTETQACIIHMMWHQSDSHSKPPLSPNSSFLLPGLASDSESLQLCIATYLDSVALRTGPES